MTFYDVPLLVESTPSENATDILEGRLKNAPEHML
ncbi:MAG: hypothetical protein RIS51_206, partial [Actinomycetota bacterium]